ncbi:hypothetical protein VTN49DRAFT_4924 [Thermomyces lanuginosus]|uniref:uncharacterized protein n=1 Tax=Thermomyces lanuginosus TaxID=5541 RepID=UPI003742DA28
MDAPSSRLERRLQKYGAFRQSEALAPNNPASAPPSCCQRTTHGQGSWKSSRTIGGEDDGTIGDYVPSQGQRSIAECCSGRTAPTVVSQRGPSDAAVDAGLAHGIALAGLFDPLKHTRFSFLHRSSEFCFVCRVIPGPDFLCRRYFRLSNNVARVYDLEIESIKRFHVPDRLSR